MRCTTRFMNVEWNHHSWHPEVSATGYVTMHETNPFGRDVNSEAVRCRKHRVCEGCGATTADVDCICDKEYGERCAPRLAYIARTAEPVR